MSEFRQGKVDTGFIERNLNALGAVPRGPDRAAAASGVACLLAEDTATAPAEDGHEADSPWAARDGFQLTGTRSITVPVLIDGENANAALTFDKHGMSVAIDGETPAPDAKLFEAGEDVYVLRDGRQTRVRLKEVSAATSETGAGDGVVTAPMHGKVLELFAAAGDHVTGGQRVAVIEAMKMEHTLRAPFAGVVTKVPVTVGAQVVEDAQIMVIEPAPAG